MHDFPDSPGTGRRPPGPGWWMEGSDRPAHDSTGRLVRLSHSRGHTRVRREARGVVDLLVLAGFAGFFVVGSTRGIYREVKVRLLTLDVPHPPMEPRPRVSLPIRHASAGGVASVLARLLPEARIAVDAEVISVEGPAEVRGWAVSLVEILDEDPPTG